MKKRRTQASADEGRNSSARLAELVIHDPYKQSNVVVRPPRGLRLRLDNGCLENTYRHPMFPHEKVRCAACGAARHRDGYTFLQDDGRRYLLGSSCGKVLFGDGWEKVRRQFDDKVRALTVLKWFEDVWPRLMPAIVQIERHWRPLALRIDRARKELLTLGPAVEMVAREASRNGELRLSKKVRKLSTLNRRDDTDDDEKSGTENPFEGFNNFEWIETVAHRISGGMFLRLIDPIALVSEADRALRRLHTLNDGAPSALKVGRSRSEAQAALDGLATLESMRVATALFYGEANLRGIASWANAAQLFPDRYKSNGQQLENISTGKFVTAPTLPTVGTEVLQVLSGSSGVRRVARRG